MLIRVHLWFFEIKFFSVKDSVVFIVYNINRFRVPSCGLKVKGIGTETQRKTLWEKRRIIKVQIKILVSLLCDLCVSVVKTQFVICIFTNTCQEASLNCVKG